MQNDLHQRGQQEALNELIQEEIKVIKSINGQNWAKRFLKLIQIRFKYVKLRNKLRDKLYFEKQKNAF